MSTIKFRNFIRAVFLLTLLTPTLSFAVGGTDGFVNLNKLILSFANGVVRSTGYMLFTLAVVAFFWGIVQFIWSARQGAEGKGIQKGTQFMKWGLIAIFVMFSLWGIIKFAQDVFQIQGENTIIVPSLDFIQSGGNGLNDTNGGNIGCPPPGILSGGRCINPQTGATGNTAFDKCIAAGGGVVECRAQTGTYAGSGAGTNANGAGAGSINTQAKADALAQQCASAPGGNLATCQNAANAALANYLAGAGANKKGWGYDCTDSSQCASGYCDANNVCSNPTAGEKGFGYDCTDSSQCASGYCDANNTCSTPLSGEKPWGYSCGNSSECQSGFCDPADNTCSTPQQVGKAESGCQYAFTGCTTSSGQTGQCDDQLNCNFKDMNTYGCTDKTASNWDPYANTDNGTCIESGTVNQNDAFPSNVGTNDSGINVAPGSDGTQLQWNCDDIALCGI